MHCGGLPSKMQLLPEEFIPVHVGGAGKSARADSAHGAASSAKSKTCTQAANRARPAARKKKRLGISLTARISLAGDRSPPLRRFEIRVPCSCGRTKPGLVRDTSDRMEKSGYTNLF